MGLSGLPELTSGLKEFLLESRYKVQLQQGRTQLNEVLQQIELVCRERLGQLGFKKESKPHELSQELIRLQGKRDNKRIELLRRRTGMVL